MWRLTKGLLWIIGVFLIVLIGAVAWGRLRPPNQAQATALALLQQEQQPSRGRNAWATFWLLDYDVPAEKVDETYARERAHLFAWADKVLPGDPSAPEYDSLVAREYPRLPVISASDRNRLCHVNDVDCLGKVREQVQPLRALLEQQAVRLARVHNLTADDFLWDDTPLNFSTPLPPFATAENLQLTDAALDFVEGRQQQALSRVCGDVRTLRQLHAHTNSLIGAMVMISWTEATERLFADMLAELPADQSVPADCEAAFVPVTSVDVDLCAPMQREYQLMLTGMAPIDPAKVTGMKRWERHRLFDMNAAHALLAPVYAWSCHADVRQAMLSDRKLLPTQMPKVRYDIFDIVSNPVGVILVRIASPEYASYLNRNTDLAAGLRLMRMLLQAHNADLSSSALQQRLAQDLATLRQAGARAYQIDTDGRHVRMTYYALRPRRSALVLKIVQ